MTYVVKFNDLFMHVDARNYTNLTSGISVKM